MRKLITLTIFIFSLSSIFSQEEINWMTWQEAVTQSEKDSVPKKMFIDLYTDWCGWCKRMDQSTFANKDVVKYINENYYAIKIDAEMRDSIQFGGNLYINSNPKANAPKRKGVHMLAYSLLDGNLSYPSYVILDENKARITILKGYKTVVELMPNLQFFTTNQYYFYKQYLEDQNKKMPQTK